MESTNNTNRDIESKKVVNGFNSTRNKVNLFKKKFKDLCKLALLGTMAVGCTNETYDIEKDNYELADLNTKESNDTNLIISFNVSDCKTVKASVVYPEPVKVILTDVADETNKVIFDVSGEVDPETNKVSSDINVLDTPLHERTAELEVLKSSDMSKVEFCHINKEEDCINGPSKVFCKIMNPNTLE